jgi:glycosyltransferase involved in cell wall biosynthesis
MKILITNHWLKKLGGSETFTYTLVKAAKEFGCDVDLFTNQPGMVSERIEKDFGVKNVKIANSYDLILANHNTCVKHCFNHGPIIQTCHGTIPKLEQPSNLANAYVGISEEVKNHLLQQLSGKPKIEVILNGIDTNRFKDSTGLSPNVKSVLSLSHSEWLNNSLKLIFNKIGIQFKALNKYQNPVWAIENEILQHDMVVSLGRGAYEALACGRPVLVLDHRPYIKKTLADGLLTPENINEYVKFNFSGRCRNHEPIFPQFIDNELALYNDNNQLFYRQWAIDNVNYLKNFDKYIDLWKRL